MKKPSLLVLAAWLVQLVSWFLPVVRGTEPRALVPGWEAFRVASCAVWPYQDCHFDAWYYAVLSTVSAITTVLFVLASPLIVFHGSPSLQKASAWTAAAAFIVNAHWYVLFGRDRSDLMIGYFLWWLSFLVLAAGLFSLGRNRYEH